MYLPLRIFSQQNQDSPFRLGAVTIVAGHSGPETAADARSHFGIFSPQVWHLFPRGQVINLYFWDYNDVAPGYFAAVQASLATKETAVLVVHVARPDSPVADRTKFADSDLKAAAKGLYLLREFDNKSPKMGTVLVQGSSATVNVVANLDKLNSSGINVRIIAVISEDLFRLQPKQYQNFIFPDSARYDCMVITTMTKRIEVLSDLGPLTQAYSLSSDFDDRWRSGGLEEDIIAEAHLDAKCTFDAIVRFAKDHSSRIQKQLSALQPAKL
jgi:transketolase